MGTSAVDVRFTLENRHTEQRQECLLSANSGQLLPHARRLSREPLRTSESCRARAEAASGFLLCGG